MKSLYYYTRQKIIPYLLGRAIKGLTLFLSMTYSYKIQGFDEFNRFAKNHPAILALWHQKLFIIPCLLYKFTPFSYAALVSKSKDGEILSQIIDSYRRGEAVRIRHNAKSAGLIGAIDSIKKKQKVLVLTPDGPKGPAHKIKGGIFTIAKNANAFIFPINWSSTTYWNLNTWDRMIIPKPFSTVFVSIGAPLPQEVHSLDKERASALLQKEIDQLLNN